MPIWHCRTASSLETEAETILSSLHLFAARVHVQSETICLPLLMGWEERRLCSGSTIGCQFLGLIYMEPSYLKTLLVFLLLFINYTEPEIYLIGFFKVGLHSHNLRECFLGMFEGAITVVKYSDAVPEFGFLIKIVSLGNRNTG